jgi:hypothetical protein
MSAATVISGAASAGVYLELDGGLLKMKAAAKPPDRLLAEIRAHKAEIVALLRDQSKPEDLDAAAIAVKEAEMDRVQAEFQRQLAELREANAEVYTNPTPWKVKS